VLVGEAADAGGFDDVDSVADDGHLCTVHWRAGRGQLVGGAVVNTGVL
jgi:hypothetical protein